MRSSIYKPPDQPAAETARIALRPSEMAKSLGVSEKHLWAISTPRGSLPCVKIGNARCAYFPHQVRQWADQQLADQRQATQEPDTESEVGER